MNRFNVKNIDFIPLNGFLFFRRKTQIAPAYSYSEKCMDGKRIHKTKPLLKIFSKGVWSSIYGILLPAAAQRLVQIDHGIELAIFCINEIQLRIKCIFPCCKYFQIINKTIVQ